MNCMAFTYYVTIINGQMHVCLIASSIKIITKRVAVVYDGFMMIMIDWKIVSSCTDSRHGLQNM